MRGDHTPDNPKEHIAGRMLCPFCSAPWSGDNVRVFNLDAGDHCDSGRFYSECCSISIVCHACEREMYRKDGQAID